MADPDYENMSDEEISSLSRPQPTENVSDGSQEPQDPIEQPVDQPADDSGNQSQGSDDDGSNGSNGTGDDGQDSPGDEGDPASKGNEEPSGNEGAGNEGANNPLADPDEADGAKPKVPAEKPDAGKQEAPKGEAPKDSAAKPAVTAETKPAAPAIDYEAAYKQIMAPFKANGKEISLANPAEAIQLMQMGANYTKKLQALQPQLKMMKMLENNGLLDENKLSYLIDLDKKNPEAIKKLVSDSGIDPLEIDTTAESKYNPGKYAVSDQEMIFNDTLQEVHSSDAGKQTIALINKEWDKTSKEAIYKDPQILRIITNHKETGVYDQIASEVERQQMMGNLRGIPYLNAYYQVGKAMGDQGRLNQPQAPVTAPVQPQVVPPVQQREVLETRSAPRKPAVDPNGEKAKAASPVKTAPKGAAQEFNPLSMSDEEFEKTASMAKRL